MAKEKSMEEVLEEIASTQESIDKAIGEKADRSEIDKLREKIDGLREKANNERIEAFEKKINDIVLSHGEEITALKDKGEIVGVAGKHAALSDMIMKGIQENAEKIKGIVENGGNMSIEMKAAGTMTITNNYTGGTVGLSTLEPGITRVQRRRPFLRQLVNVGGLRSKFIVWIEMANPDPGVAGMVEEGALKPQTDFDLVERQGVVRKIAVWIKVSKEMMEDVPFIEAEIRNELMELVELKLDEQILSGDNVSPNMNGILEYAPTFDAGTFAGTIPYANRFDVLRVAIAQIEKANFLPNYILLNPEDIAKMELSKDLEGRYLWPWWATERTVHGVTIVANNGIPVGTFVVGDFTKANLRIREEMNLQVGYVNDDFTRNLVTILAEMRAVFYIKTNHLGAFVQGSFDTAILALNFEAVEVV